MDRVLEAERVARSAIAECEKQGREFLEHARQHRRTILERAQQRIVALHAGSARAVERRVAQIRNPHGADCGAGGDGRTDRARLQAAIEQLADRLISPGDEES